jgi:site-specific recombinase XerD
MSITNPTIKIVQKDFIRQDGTKNTFVRLTICRKIKYFSLNIFVRPEHFKKSTISKADPDHREKNALLDLYFLKAKKIVFDYRIQDKELTFEQFYQNFYNANYGSDSFYNFYESQVELLKGKLAPNTIKAYKSQLVKLRAFKKELTFNDIDLNFITAYEGFIKHEKGNNQNTVTKSIKFIKGILGRAVDQGIIKENPIKGYKMHEIQGDRHFLTMEELIVLEELLNGNKLKTNKKNVLKYFLFCCYTGLRFQDIKELRYKDIKESSSISVQMIKTKEFVKIPLTEKAKNLIPANGFDNQKVFKVMTGQPTNRYLKVIMEEAKINKKISFHCARHTFATVSKSLGISYDVISKMLGHTNLKTTKIYTRYEMTLLNSEMEKWNK